MALEQIFKVVGLQIQPAYPGTLPITKDIVVITLEREDLSPYGQSNLYLKATDVQELGNITIGDGVKTVLTKDTELGRAR